MGMGQTMLSVGALLLISMFMMSFYRMAHGTGQTLDNAQGGITALTLATSYMELAQRLEFDETSRGIFDPDDPDSWDFGDLTLLTHPKFLGVDGVETQMKYAGKQAMYEFNDIDDFNGDTLYESQVGGRNEDFVAAFRVVYVNREDLMGEAEEQTPYKRLDMTIWREFPVSTDTLRTSLILGYWKFRF
jgi:hypothetical protein